LAWQLSAQWKFDPDLLTEVEVRFIAEGERLTRVEFEHRGLENYGDQAEAVRKSISSPGGWPGILDSYVAAVDATERGACPFPPLRLPHYHAAIPEQDSEVSLNQADL